jgi:hypothetical protein
MNRRSMLVSMIVAGVGLGMTACAAGSAASGSASAGTTSASPVTSTGLGPPEPSDAGSAVPVQPGKVTVTVDEPSYRAGATVSATIANGLSHPIFTTDFKTACTIALLQRQASGAWTDIIGCRLGRPTATVTIGPGAARTVEFDPHSFHLTHGDTGLAFGAGSYRLKFTYRLESAPEGDEPLTAYSAEFTIR